MLDSLIITLFSSFFFFFFNDTATTEIYTLSLTTLFRSCNNATLRCTLTPYQFARDRLPKARDRKSTRLNSSHEWISYAVFCLKKKKKKSKKKMTNKKKSIYTLRYAVIQDIGDNSQM